MPANDMCAYLQVPHATPEITISRWDRDALGEYVWRRDAAGDVIIKEPDSGSKEATRGQHQCRAVLVFAGKLSKEQLSQLGTMVDVFGRLSAKAQVGSTP